MQTDEKMLELVRRVPLFRDFRDEAITHILSSASKVQAPRGKLLFQQGDDADCFYIIMSGWVKLYRNLPDGRQVVLHTFTAGEAFAEAAILGSGVYPATSEVVEDSILLAFSGNGFLSQIRDNSDLALRMLASMSIHMRHLVAQMEQLGGRPTTHRLADFLIGLCDNDNEDEMGSARLVQLPYDKSLVAARLGMQPETLSRAFGKLRKLGVESKRGGVVISDIDALADFCQSDAG